MISLSKLKEIQSTISDLQKKRDKASGSKETILTRLQEEFGVSSIEKAEKLLEREKEKLKELKEDAEKEEKDFIKKHKDKLHELNISFEEDD